MYRLLLAAMVALGSVWGCSSAPQETAAPEEKVTPQENADGWKPMFDGTSLAGWRGYQSEELPSGWRAADGELVFDGKGGDLMTVEQYGDFEMEFEWKVTPNGNSGVIYRIATTEPYPWHTGPEYQILDNGGHPDGQSPLTSAGANYAVNPPVEDVTKPVGEWNQGKIVARGNHVEHWMNGVKLLEYEIGSPDWEARVQASKFGKIPPYARTMRGHIALQDHGNVVAYRNLRIRELQ